LIAPAILPLDGGNIAGYPAVPFNRRQRAAFQQKNSTARGAIERPNRLASGPSFDDFV
jgi:hypothetical protein